MLNERLNYLSVFSTENDFTKSMSYEEVTNEYAAKKKYRQKKYYKGVSGG
jgi:hypothetical protein